MTESTKHIVFVNHTRELHGSEQVMMETMRQCRANGWRVTVVLPKSRPEGGLEPAIGNDAEVLYLNYKNSGEGWLRTWAIELYNLPAVIRLARWIRRHKVDLVYSNSSVTLPGVEAARWAHVPHIWHWHELPSKEFGWTESTMSVLRYWKKYSTRILFISKIQQEIWRRALGDCPLDNAQVIYNPVRTVHVTEKVRHETVRIGYVGGFNERKNLSWLIQTVKELAQTYDIRLDLYGAKETKENGIIHIHPFTNDVAPVYANLDIFVLPSWSETMPLVVMEAMQAGICVIQTDQSGMKELMHDGRECLFVCPNNKESLRNALIRCMDASFRDEIAAHGKQFTNQWMEQNNYQRNITTVFKSLL